MNHEWLSGLALNELYHRGKSIHTEGTNTFCKMCWFCRPYRWPSIWWRTPTPSWEIQSQQWTHNHCICRWTYTVGCNTFPEVCKLKPAHYLLSLSLLWQYLSFREAWPPLSSGLVTVLLQPGQFSAFGNSLPSFFNHDQQQISCFIHGSKIVNYHKAVVEDIPFIWQKIERNLT